MAGRSIRIKPMKFDYSELPCTLPLRERRLLLDLYAKREWLVRCRSVTSSIHHSSNRLCKAACSKAALQGLPDVALWLLSCPHATPRQGPPCQNSRRPIASISALPKRLSSISCWTAQAALWSPFKVVDMRRTTARGCNHSSATPRN